MGDDGAGAAVVVLVHSPLTGPEAWGRLPDVLRSRGQQVVVVEVRDDREPPYAPAYIAHAALQIRSGTAGAGDADRPVLFVGHSGAGYLLPSIGAARRAGHGQVAGYVFVDAGLPPSRAAHRLDLLRSEDPHHGDAMERQLAGGGSFPDWTDDDLRTLVPDELARARLMTSLRPRGNDFFTERLPVVPDWPEAPCGYLRLSPAYDVPARLARLRGWPVLVGPDDRPGGHFAMLVDPESVAEDLDTLLAQM